MPTMGVRDRNAARGRTRVKRKRKKRKPLRKVGAIIAPAGRESSGEKWGEKKKERGG